MRQKSPGDLGRVHVSMCGSGRGAFLPPLRIWMWTMKAGLGGGRAATRQGSRHGSSQAGLGTGLSQDSTVPSGFLALFKTEGAC